MSADNSFPRNVRNLRHKSFHFSAGLWSDIKNDLVARCYRIQIDGFALMPRPIGVLSRLSESWEADDDHTITP